MPFYEYKKHRQTFSDVLVDPEFIRYDQGNMLYDPDNKTYVCYIPAEVKRDYYIPDTLVEITKEELLSRALKISQAGFIGTADSPMSVEEITQWINGMWSDFEQLYNEI